MNEILQCFRKTGVSDVISEETFVSYYNRYLAETPAVEQIQICLPADDVVSTIISYYSTSNNVENPLAKVYKERLKEHDFFKERKYICAAPYTTLRFCQDGSMNVCCSKDSYIIGTYPGTTPLKAWMGEGIRKLRSSLDNFDFSNGCMKCANFILNDHQHQPMLTEYDVTDDTLSKNPVLPTNLVFQFHNTCNYECIMCGGEHSSLIRKNRDRLPALPKVYDQEFFKHIIPFIKYAKKIEVLGGEPFATSQCYELCDLLIQHNPSVQISFTTNGSIYTQRIEDILTKLPNSTISISLDTVDRETYSFIRRGGNLDNVLANLDKFLSVSKVMISVCPLIQNVYELPDIIDFCIQRDIDLWIAEVEFVLGGKMYSDLYETGYYKREGEQLQVETKIPEFRLWTLPVEEKLEIKQYLKRRKYPKRYQEKLDSFIGFLMSGT